MMHKVLSILYFCCPSSNIISNIRFFKILTKLKCDRNNNVRSHKMTTGACNIIMALIMSICVCRQSNKFLLVLANSLVLLN